MLSLEIGKLSTDVFPANDMRNGLLPEILLVHARQMVDELIENAQSLEIEQARIQNELDTMILERPWVINYPGAQRGDQ